MAKTRYTLSPFRVLEFQRAGLHAAYSYRYEKVEIGDAVFHLIPNMLRSGDYLTAYDELVCDRERFNILVTHGLSTTLKDHRLNTVAEHEIDATMLAGQFDYVALGHYHGQVQVGSRAWYSGSAEYLSYGEIHDTKGALWVELDQGSIKHLPLVHTPMMDLGIVDCTGEPARAVPGMIRAEMEKKTLEPLSLAQVTVVCQDREQARAIDHRALAAVPDEQDIRAIDFLAEFDVFLKKKNLAPREAEFVRKEGKAALQAALMREDEDAH
jgi:exonuclease SbcD